MAWLEIPLGVVMAYLANLNRLRAEDALQNVSEAMIGTGNMEKRYAERALNDWQREADGPIERDSPLIRTEEERIELYRETGFFQVEIVPPPQEVTSG